MNNITPPNTAEFQKLEKYVTMDKDAWEDGEYANTWDSYFKSGTLPDEFLPWMRHHWEYLKYLYIKNFMALDGTYATITFEQYCKEAYSIYKHNIYLEQLENIGEEITNLIGEVK